jgi:hypothetical protein
VKEGLHAAAADVGPRASHRLHVAADGRGGNDEAHDLGEAERDDREVVAAQAQAR